MARFTYLCAALLCGLVFLGPGAAAGQARTHRAGTRDPSGNHALSDATLNACTQAINSPACISAALSDIDAARAAEGVAPMLLPSDFPQLTVPAQLVLVTNLERTARGLAPASGPTAHLDHDAAIGARAIDDPPVPSPIGGLMFASLMAYGYESPLESDFAWMYDDGPGSPNIDCRHAGDSGCWGHRHNILMNFPPPIEIGTAALFVQGQWSMTIAIVGGAGQ